MFNRPLGKVLLDQAFGVFIAAALPGAEWVSKIHPNASVCGQHFMPAHLPVLAICQGVPHGTRNSDISTQKNGPIIGPFHITPTSRPQLLNIA